MKKVAEGIYQFDVWDPDMPCSPEYLKLDALSVPSDVPAFSLEKTAVIRLLQFSVSHGKWCGVAMQRLLVEVRERDLHAFSGINLAINLMIRQKLIVVSKRSKWFDWLDWFSPRILCPTPMLVSQILAHQKAGRCCGRLIKPA